MGTASFFEEVDYFVVGISGGKDSTALLLYLVKEFFPENKIALDKLICVFADTQNEAPETYQHVVKISEEIHPVKWLESEGFYNLARRKKRFPSTKARFCTTELKLKPLKEFLETLDGRILSVSGVRRDESEDRKNVAEFSSGLESYHGLPTWRPLVDWTIEDVFLIHKRYSFPLNPLYGMGFSRVGCLPCIMSRKKEIRLIAALMPERIEMLETAENGFTNSGGFSSFFRRNAIPERYRSREVTTKKGVALKVGTIRDVVTWSQTADRKRSSQFSFHFEDYESPFAETSCMAGVCE